MTGLRRRASALVLASVSALAACGSAPGVTARPLSVRVTSSPAVATPQWKHVVVVVEENHAYGRIIGRSDAPYFNRLARSGANFIRYFAITHPSQPNYIALFSGSTRRVTDDSCPHDLAANNLGHQLLANGRTFVGYSEGLPATGSQACTSGRYARKHAPWVDFTDLPGSVNRPLRRVPSRFSALPDLAFVIPDLDHDMHDGTVAQADSWLRRHLGAYARWAPSHHSLLIVTWDEDDDTARNQIPTIAVGAGVTQGRSAQRVDHYDLLRTLEDGFGVQPLGAARHATDLHALLR